MWYRIKFKAVNTICHVSVPINSLSVDKIVDWSKLKAFADDKLEVVKIILFVFDRVVHIVHIVGRGENAGYFSHNVYKKTLNLGSLKVGIVW